MTDQIDNIKNQTATRTIITYDLVVWCPDKQDTSRIIYTTMLAMIIQQRLEAKIVNN